MNIGELKKLLDQYPDDIEVVCNKHNYIKVLLLDGCYVMDGVSLHGVIFQASRFGEEKVVSHKFLRIGI